MCSLGTLIEQTASTLSSSAVIETDRAVAYACGKHICEHRISHSSHSLSAIVRLDSAAARSPDSSGCPVRAVPGPPVPVLRLSSYLLRRPAPPRSPSRLGSSIQQPTVASLRFHPAAAWPQGSRGPGVAMAAERSGSLPCQDGSANVCPGLARHAAKTGSHEPGTRT